MELTANNIFVCYALLFCAIIFALILIFVKKQKLLRNLLLTIIGMAGFSFALVPLYNVFCDVTGLNGKLDLTVQSAKNQHLDYSRTITVEFVVNHNHEMPWEFKPKHKSLTLHPGQLATTAYFARNTTKRTMTAQAIPSIAPSRVSKFFKKTECFCFSSQKLGPGESAYLTLSFYLHPDIPKDVQRLTLAYTIFDVTKSDNQQEHDHG